jgi:hypothetical protein
MYFILHLKLLRNRWLTDGFLETNQLRQDLCQPGRSFWLGIVDSARKKVVVGHEVGTATVKSFSPRLKPPLISLPDTGDESPAFLRIELFRCL